MKIYTDTPEGFTVIHNAFIDQYMPHASGEYVKVYLYLLRCADTQRELSLSSIADVFDHTENDIRRALAYWEKQHLLRLRLGKDGSVQAVTFMEIPGSAVAGAEDAGERGSDFGSGRTVPEERSKDFGGGRTADNERAADFGAAASVRTIDERDMPDRERVARAREQKEIRQLFYVAEQYLQRPLTSSEQRDFIYYYDHLKFSTDLIEYLLEYCISKGCANRHYMRKVALGWAEAGITTVLQAKQETNLHNKNYFTVMNAFGIKNRNPAASEQEAMSRWFNEFGFSIDIVLEACNRTIRQTHQPSFDYAGKILEGWHKSGVSSLADIGRLDSQRRAGQKNAQKSSAQGQKNTSGATNRFNNFSQRDYDFDQLEKQLLNQ